MELVIFGILLATGVGVFAARTLVMRSGDARVQEVLLRSAADRLGGTVRPLAVGHALELAPDRDGIERFELRYVQLPNVGDPQRMRLQITLRRLLPTLSLSPQGAVAEIGVALGRQDIECGDPDLDRRFIIASPEPEVAVELFGAAVVRAVFGLSRGQPGTIVWIEVEPDPPSGMSTVVVHCSGWLGEHQPVRDLVSAGLELGRALVRAWDKPWLDVAHGRGLAVGKLAQRGASSLVGVLGEIPIEARVRRRPAGWRTEVSAWVDSLPGLRVVHRDTARDEGWDEEREGLGNPVLDMLVAARADDADALRALLGGDRIIDALLPVVHGRPGSSLQHDSVRLVVPGRLTDGLDEAIDDVVALATLVMEAGRAASG